MSCQWCQIMQECEEKAQALLDAGVHPDHPNIQRLMRRARGARLFVTREHGPITFNWQCPGDET